MLLAGWSGHTKGHKIMSNPTPTQSNNKTLLGAISIVGGIIAVCCIGLSVFFTLALNHGETSVTAGAGIAEVSDHLESITAPAEVDHAALIAAADAEFNAKSDKVVAARVSRDAVALVKAAGWQDNDAQRADAEDAKVALAKATDDARDASAAYREAAKGADVTVSDAHKAVSDAYETAYRATDSDARASADADVTAKRLEFNATIGA